MRLTCPKCSAKYEVPDEVIPTNGRDVQCSNCDEIWFQNHPDHPRVEIPGGPPEPAKQEESAPSPVEIALQKNMRAAPETAQTPEPEPEPAAAPAPEPKRERSLDPAVANILREEAARESELRAKEADSLESQPELGLETASVSNAPPKPEPEKPASTMPRSNALPDVDEINSSLRGRDNGRTSGAASRSSTSRGSTGFLRGFALIVILGVGLMMVYGNAAQISHSIPQADPMLQAYVTMVDQARVWLEAKAAAIQP